MVSPTLIITYQAQQGTVDNFTPKNQKPNPAGFCK